MALNEKDIERLKKEVVENANLRKDLIESSINVLAKYGFELDEGSILPPLEAPAEKGTTIPPGGSHGVLILVKGPKVAVLIDSG